MNERIKELAIQAGFFYEDYKDIWYLEYHNQTCEEEMKKFAELIVRECVRVVDETITGNQEMNLGLVMASAAIVSHFGVEE